MKIVKESTENIKRKLENNFKIYLWLLIIGFIFLGISEFTKSFFVLGVAVLYFILAGHIITHNNSEKIILELRELKK